MGVSTVVSYSRLEIYETLPGMQIATYRIPPAKGLTPSILHVADTHYYKPDIEGRQDQVFVPSFQVANSIVHMYVTSQLGYTVDTMPGVFAIEEKQLNADEIMKNYPDRVKTAIAKQRAWFRFLVKMADDDWQVAHRHNMISDIQRIAAKELNVNREWLSSIDDEEATIVTPCPFCGSGLLNPEAPICPHCNKVHNPAKMKELEARIAGMMKVPETVKA